MKVVYRRYASLFFIVGVKQDGEVSLDQTSLKLAVLSGCWR